MPSIEKQCDAVVSKKEEWAAKSYDERIAYLLKIRENLEQHCDDWARCAAEQRSYGDDSAESVKKFGHLQYETYLIGAAMAGLCTTFLIDSHTSLKNTGKHIEVDVRDIDGQKAVKVFPYNKLFGAFSAGLSAETWLTEGADPKTDDPTKKPAGVSTVLCAGNFDAFNDILTSLFKMNKVVLAKSNPVNEKTSSVIQKILAPLVDDGYLLLTSGDISVGQALLNVEESEQMILTGSHHSVNRIVWGDPKDQEENKRMGKKCYGKNVVAELGSVNPFIITPGQWTDKEIDHHAENLACNKMANAGHICASPQVVITAANWPQRERFLERVRYFLGKYPAVRSYYPNSKKAWDAHHKYCEPCDVIEAPKFKGDDDLGDQLDRIFKIGIKDDSHFALQNEAFCAVLTEFPLDMDDGETPFDFLRKAVKFANEKCWGTLSATIIIKDDQIKKNKDELDRIIKSFKIGAVGINIWGGFGAVYSIAPWGAFPGHTLEDVQSGIGQVNNFAMLDNAERSVLWAPFLYQAAGKLPPPGHVAKKIGTRFAHFTIDPSVWRLVKLLGGLLAGI